MFSEYIELFLEHMVKHRSITANTVAAYRNDLRQFGEILVDSRVDSDPLPDPPPQGERVREAGVELRRLDSGDVAGFVLNLRERGYAEATVARKMAAVKSFFHFAVQKGVVANNPAAVLDCPRVPRSVPQAIDPADMQRLLDIGCSGNMADDLRDRAMLTLLYHSGMRVSELVALNVDDVDLDASTVRCRGRAGRIRSIPLDEPAKKTLRGYMADGRPVLIRAEGEDAAALFLNHRGTRLTRQGFWLIMKECARRAGILQPITPHTLRHSFALHHLGSGTTLRDLKELLGHVNISTTQIYTLAHREARSPAS